MKNIVKIYDIYSLNGSSYIKEEFVQGHTIEDMIIDNQITLEVFFKYWNQYM